VVDIGSRSNGRVGGQVRARPLGRPRDGAGAVEACGTSLVKRSCRKVGRGGQARSPCVGGGSFPTRTSPRTFWCRTGNHCALRSHQSPTPSLCPMLAMLCHAPAPVTGTQRLWGGGQDTPATRNALSLHLQRFHTHLSQRHTPSRPCLSVSPSSLPRLTCVAVTVRRLASSSAGLDRPRTAIVPSFSREMTTREPPESFPSFPAWGEPGEPGSWGAELGCVVDRRPPYSTHSKFNVRSLGGAALSMCPRFYESLNLAILVLGPISHPQSSFAGSGFGGLATRADLGSRRWSRPRPLVRGRITVPSRRMDSRPPLTAKCLLTWVSNLAGSERQASSVKSLKVRFTTSLLFTSFPCGCEHDACRETSGTLSVTPAVLCGRVASALRYSPIVSAAVAVYMRKAKEPR